MFRACTDIVFEAGNVLSAQMLEETYRYPREFLRLSYASCCDGIITGLDYISRDDSVYLTAGIVKWNGKYHILPQDENLDVWLKAQNLSSGIPYHLCLVQEAEEHSGYGIASKIQMTLRVLPKRPESSLSLGVFRFDMGKLSLPEIKMDANEPFEEFWQKSRLRLLDAAYAHPQGETTFHPLLFRAICNYLEHKSSPSPYDFSLLMELQNHGIASLASLKTYVAAYNGSLSSVSGMSREELFRAVVQCAAMPYRPTEKQQAASEQVAKAKPKSHSKLIT